MSCSFTITKYHKTYYRDALIFGLIGFVSAFVYFVLRVFTEFVAGGVGLIVLVFLFIYKLKAKFKPESYEFKPLDDKITIWRKSEFKNEQPYVRQFLSYDRTAEGLQVTVKDLGESTLKTQFLLSTQEYGEENLTLLCDFLSNLQHPNSGLPDKSFNVAFKKRSVPADVVGYFVTIGIFFCIDVSLNEDPKKYTFLNSVISPVDYEVVVPVDRLSSVDEAKIANSIAAYQLNKKIINKPFPKRYVSIRDFENSLEITHKFEYDGGEPSLLIIEFSSAYDEAKLKRIYDIIAKDIQANLGG